MHTNTITFLSLIALLILSVSLPARAADEGDWQLRLRGAWVNPDLDYRHVGDDGTAGKATSGSDVGFGLGLEYRLSDLVGLELAALRSAPEVDLELVAPSGDRFTDSSALRSMSYSLGINFHLMPDAAADVYVGVLAAWIDYGDLGFSVNGEHMDFAVDHDWAWGATAGFDLPFGDSGWSMNAGLSFVDSSLDVDQIGVAGDDAPSLAYDTLVGTLGVGYSF